jgi:hypothetical protein
MFLRFVVMLCLRAPNTMVALLEGPQNVHTKFRESRSAGSRPVSASLTAPILVAQVWKAPHVGQVDGESYD